MKIKEYSAFPQYYGIFIIRLFSVISGHSLIRLTPLLTRLLSVWRRECGCVYMTYLCKRIYIFTCALIEIEMETSTHWWVSETSGQVHISWKQRLVYPKYHCTTSESMDSYRHMEVWPVKYNKMQFFPEAIVSILLYGWTTWTLTKRVEKRLEGNCSRILRAVMNKFWKQHSTKQQLYGHLPSISKTIQVRRARHAGHCCRSRDELTSDELH